MCAKPEWIPQEPAPALKQPAVGRLVRELRQLLGCTQEQFAAIVGISFSTLNRWENGHIQPSPLAFKQVYNILIQLTQSPIPELHEGSHALLKKYLEPHRETASQRETNHPESTLNSSPYTRDK